VRFPQQAGLITCIAGAILACYLSPNPTLAGSITQVLDFRGHRALDRPVGVTVDTDGYLYVPSHRTDRLLKISPHGVMDLSYGPYWPDFHLSDTADVALSANGVAYVTGRRVVVRIDVDGSISEFAVPPDGLLGPADLAVDPEGTVYISWNSNRVWKYTPEGQGVEIVDETGDGDGHPLVSPIAVAVDSDHNVYVVSATNDLVFKVTSTGSVTVVLDHSGDGMGHILDGPVDLAIDGADNLFVAGAFSRNAFRVRPDGEITELIDRFGTSAGNQTQIAQPSGVATILRGTFI